MILYQWLYRSDNDPWNNSKNYLPFITFSPYDLAEAMIIEESYLKKQNTCKISGNPGYEIDLIKGV